MSNHTVIPTFGLGIDWETSGFSLPHYTTKHQGISFGAVIFDMRSLEPVDVLYREIKFDDRYEWDAYAESIHGLSRDHLKLNGVDQSAAAIDLANLVVKYIGTGDVILLGHRVHFDRAFTNQLMDSIGIQLNYHPTVIDSCAMATLLMEQSKSDDIFSTLGLPPRQKHNALEDIYYTLESAKRMKEYFLVGVASTVE